MESQPSPSPADMGDQATKSGIEELTNEKLILKYKTLAALTNKMKTAKNAALMENEVLKKELEETNAKIKSLKQQNLNVEEMLGVLTEQKLKMAMEIDELNKERQRHSKNTKEFVSQEIEICKEERNRLHKENAELLLQLKDKEENEVHLQNDIKKLQENNENVIVLISNARKEKLDLQNQLEEILTTLKCAESENKLVYELLSKEFNRNFENLLSIKQYFEQDIKTFCKYQCAEEINVLLDKNLNLKNKVEELNNTIITLNKEKECSESKCINLLNSIENLKTELYEVTSDRDQIMNNLECVRLETKQLIENSEKLVDELEILKLDKKKNENDMYSAINNKNNEIENLNCQILELQQQNEDQRKKLISCREFIKCMLEMKKSCFKENTVTEDEGDTLNLETGECKSDNQIIDEFINKFLTDLSNLSSVKNSFGSMTESIQNLNFTMLLHDVQSSEEELLKIINRIEDTPEKSEIYTCSNIRCSCLLLKNVSIKIKECMQNYEKTVTDLKHELDFIKEQFSVLLSRKKKRDCNKDGTSYIPFDNTKQAYKDNEVHNIPSKMEEYYVLNNLLEKKIQLCRDELGCALMQLHNAEDLGEIMQREIYSLQKHLCEVISEREKLNDVINDKIMAIIKLDEELIVEQTKSRKLLNDLELSQIELDESKKALDKKCKELLDRKGETVNIITRISELSACNNNLIQENDNLKVSIQDLTQKSENKDLELEEKNRLINELINSTTQMNAEISKLCKNKMSNEKLSFFKLKMKDFREEISTLKKEFNCISENTMGHFISLGNLNQETKLLEQDLFEYLHSLKNKDIADGNIKKIKEFSNLADSNITTVLDTTDVNTQTDEEKLVDKECQVYELTSETKVQTSKTEDSDLMIKNDELSKPAEIEDNSAKIQSLETSLALSKQELATAQLEISQLREEFHSYRLRAQALLSKQKGELESQREKEAKEQIEKLNNELESIRAKLELVVLEGESLKNRLSSLQTEKEITDKKYDDISRALHQKIIDYDTLNTEYNAFKLSTDTLIHNGKILLEEKYKSELSSKETIINKLKFELKERPNITSSCIGINEDLDSVSSQNVEEVLQEREEGEGSETAPLQFTERHDFVPLDVLINNSVDEEETQLLALQEQINVLTTELTSHDIRSKHLSSLLREAEKESARNAQQNAVLKEEVRRLERCLDRQPLVANTEYLKNIVFKFLTLQSVNERIRLVPVLDSILKLSPVEAQKLNDIARGEGSSKWSNYLSSWTGLG